MPLVSLDRVSIAYGHLPLLDEVTLQIDSRERVALIGRNGTGKSTLLKVVSGEIPADTGAVWRQPALKIARLDQDVPLSSSRSVFDVVAEGHTHSFDADEAWLREHQVDLVLSRLELPADAVVDTLSGGWRRRARLGCGGRVRRGLQQALDPNPGQAPARNDRGCPRRALRSASCSCGRRRKRGGPARSTTCSRRRTARPARACRRTV